MASIDIITAAGLAYKKTWDERAYLLPMIVIPLLIKYICFTLSNIFVADNNIIRMSLIMLPAYFAEGWLLAHWARTIMLNHRWPFRPSGNDNEDNKQLSERGRGVLGGTVSFLLINLLMAGYFSFFMSYIPLDMNPQEADPNVAIIGAIMMVSTLMLFRFIWFYIPLSVNIAPATFVKAVKPLRVTFQMLGLWLVCFVPSVVVLQLVGGTLNGMIEASGGNAILESILTFLRISLDMLKNLICTAGMAYAFIALLKRNK
jgi:hypothetical protein